MSHILPHPTLMTFRTWYEESIPGVKLDYRNAATPYEHVHPQPYYLQKGWNHSMQELPDKNSIKHLKKHILKYDKRHNLASIGNQIYQLNKWLEKSDIE